MRKGDGWRKQREGMPKLLSPYRKSVPAGAGIARGERGMLVGYCAVAHACVKRDERREPTHARAELEGTSPEREIIIRVQG